MMPHRIQPTVELMSLQAMYMNFFYVPLVLFINQYAEQLFILAFFMAFDFVTGVMASFRMRKYFDYVRFISGFSAKMFVLTLPFLLDNLSRGTQVYDNQFAEILPWGLSALIVAEFYSILGNGYTIIKGKELEDKDMLSFFILKVRKFIEAWFQAFKS